MAMRVCAGILATAALLFGAGALAVLGTWALAAATVLGVGGAVGTVTVLEGRDFARSAGARLPSAPNYLAVAGLVASDDGEATAA